MKLRLSVVLWMMAFSSLSLAASRSDRRTRGDEVFTTNGCLHCHSIDNVGGHRGPDLSGVGRRSSKVAMRKQIVHGSKAMPAYGDVLTHSQIDDLLSYLRSCRRRPAPARLTREASRSSALPGPDM